MDNKKVTLTIDDKKVEVPANYSVFQAAADAKIFIPHYCYHPDLSVAGVCRMCMVDIEKNPRLQISCNTPVAEGMVVRTQTDKVKETVKNTLELHLINHPVDCPICDKAGECKLQDYYAAYGLYQSRVELDEKVHKPKVVDIGTIVLDSERCILCTRCVRFTAEVTHTHELSIFNRGDRSVLQTYDNGPLQNEYTGNLADICPVGALTAKDFRFQCRVWFLEKENSTCALCAHGCNTTISVKPETKTVYRVEPRRNPEVNRSWICDSGRWDFHYLNSDSRIQVPKLNRDGKWLDATWHECFMTLANELQENPHKVGVALSGHLTNEEAFDTVMTLSTLGVKTFTWIVDETAVAEKTPYDQILKHKDRTSNANGLERVFQQLNLTLLKQSDFRQKFNHQELDSLWLLGIEGEDPPGLMGLLSTLPPSIKLRVHATNYTPFFERAQMMLPNTSSYEKEGTLLSALGRLQKLNQAVPAFSTSRNLHQLIFGISKGNDRETVQKNKAQLVFEEKVAGWIENQNWKKFNPMGVMAHGTP